MTDKKPTKIVKVIVIQANAEAVLVEWNDGKAVHRVTIPEKELTGESEPLVIDSAVLAMGIPYGIPWEDVFKPSLKVSDLADRLHNAGIWTASDMLAHSRELYGIIQAFYGLDVGPLIMAATQYEEVRHG